MEPTPIVLVLFAVFFIVLLLMALGAYAYIKFRIFIGPDEAAIIYGRKSKFLNKETGETKIVRNRVVSRGGATFLYPFLEKVAFVNLKAITISLEVEDLPSANFVKVDIDARAVVKVREDEMAIRTAATNFGNFHDKGVQKEFENTLHEIMQGHLRTTISTLTPEELNTGKDKFNQQVQDSSGDRLAQLGVKIVDFQMLSIKDKAGYIDKLNKGSFAETTKRMDILASNAERERAKIVSENDISVVQFNKNLKIQEELAREEQESVKIKADQNIELTEEMKKIEVANKKILLKERENEREVLDFEQEKRKRVIEANANEESSIADGKAILAIAEANAKAIELKGLAEGVREKALASAYNDLDAKAQSIFILEKMPQVLNELLKDQRVSSIFGEIAKPLANINSVKIVDFGSQNGNGPLQNYSNIAPEIFLKFITKLKELGFGDILKKIGLNTDVLDGNSLPPQSQTHG